MIGGRSMSLALAEFTEKLVPISDFSQGKAGKIFSDVYENNTEYLVLKNNQPTAVVISVNEYKEAQRKIAHLEKILEEFEKMSNYVEYETMTEEELLNKLEYSRKHANEGKTKDAFSMLRVSCRIVFCF